MATKKTDNINLNEHLKELGKITAWFDAQAEVDVEEGLLKVKEAATLIKESKDRLKEIENEFVAIQKEMADEEEGELGEE